MGIISFAKRNYIFTPKEIKKKEIVFQNRLLTVYFDKIFRDILQLSSWYDEIFRHPLLRG